MVHCRAYVEHNGQYTTTDLTLANLEEGKVWTIPTQYAIIAGKLGQLPSYYDVWVTDTNGQQLTYIQRYYASDMRSEDEQWILFENSLGGIDTFRAYGQAEATAKHTHNIAEIANQAEEYRVDTERTYKKNTGHLGQAEQRWLLDFFPSLGKYLYIDGSLRRIVVTDSDVTYKTTPQPANYTFTYKYADARPYLNLPRANKPTEVLNIKIPEIGSFTIAPRLVELQHLPLSGGALFPVQSPYAGQWAVTTAEAILNYLAHEITTAYKGDGSFGHQHTNMSVLEVIGRMGQYLTLNAQKISAGLADVAINISTNSPLWQQLLRKDTPDTARELITFLKGIAVGSGYGISDMGDALLRDLIVRSISSAHASIDEQGHGILESVKSRDYKRGLTDGRGFGIYEDEQGRAIADVDLLNVRQKTTFVEVDVRQLAFTTGDVGYTSASGKIVSAKAVGNAYRCYFLADDGEKRIANSWRVGDMAMCKTANLLSRTTKNISNRYYWRLVVAIGEETVGGKLYYYIDLSNTKGSLDLVIGGKTYACVGYDTSTENDIPQADDSLIQLGSQTDPDRQYAYILYVSEGRRVDYAGINDYDLSTHIVNEFSPRGVKIRSDNFSITSASGTGTSAPIVCDRGEWQTGTIAGHYDRFSYQGSLWLCNVGKGKTTTTEPKDGSPEWLKEVYGKKGDPGGTGYRVEAFASPGASACSEGQTDWKATYAIHVWYNEREITRELPSTRFVWSRVSEYTEGDTAWNERHAGIGNELSVTYDDLNGDTSFICRFLDRTGMRTINTAII